MPQRVLEVGNISIIKKKEIIALLTFSVIFIRPFSSREAHVRVWQSFICIISVFKDPDLVGSEISLILNFYLIGLESFIIQKIFTASWSERDSKELSDVLLL